MKDEIKEILDYCKKYVESKDENRITSLIDIYLKKLLDYITNLQEENERLKLVIKNHSIIIPKNILQGVGKE